MTKLVSKIIPINSQKTSIRLAEPEWNALNIICEQENIKRNILIELLYQNKNPQISLTNSLRLFSIIYFYHKTISLQLYEKNYSRVTSITKAIQGII